MSAARSHEVRPPGAARRDTGSIMLVVLVTMVAMSTVVVGIARYAGTVSTVQNRAEPRLESSQAVDSAMRMAISMARDNGPTSCFTTSTTYRINGIDVTVGCTTQAVYSTGTGRYGVITTANSSSATNLAGRGTGFTKDIDGSVFYNAGLVQSTNADVLLRGGDLTLSRYTSANTPVARYKKSSGSAVGCTDASVAATERFATGVSSLDARTYSHTKSCVASPWWDRAGDNTSGTTWVYPKLPPLPSYSRSGSLARSGACRVYYPGRYSGSGRLVLDGGTHYFTSGVYYFERGLEIRNGAKVVMGEGRIAGCSYDAEAAVLPTAPRAHEITGRGATLLLGGNAAVTVSNASLEINRRVSTVGTQGSEGVAIRTVNHGTTSNSVQIPADQVILSDGTLQPVASHSIKVSATSPTVQYRTSSLGVGSYAVDVTLNGSSNATNRFVADGYVFTPNAGIRVASTVRTYRLSLNSGIVASSMLLDMSQAPSVGTDWLVGSVSSTIQRKMQLTATAVQDGETRTARAVVEVHQDRTFAVNSWTTSIT